VLQNTLDDTEGDNSMEQSPSWSWWSLS